jgi:hypothetical protein
VLHVSPISLLLVIVIIIYSRVYYSVKEFPIQLTQTHCKMTNISHSSCYRRFTYDLLKYSFHICQ